jgi:GTPase SAR1 family protein
MPLTLHALLVAILSSSVTRSYYRGAAGALLVYDITSRDTYNHLISWLTDAKTLASESISIIAVGNKADLAEDREVTFLECSRFAQDNGECAARTHTHLPFASLGGCQIHFHTFANRSISCLLQDLMFLEGSALTGEAIEEIFMKCAKRILDQVESGELDPSLPSSGIQSNASSRTNIAAPPKVVGADAGGCAC